MNLKELLNNTLNEGGAAGHMMHPYDKFETAADMLEFFENFLAGKIRGTEKVDGYNLFAGLQDGKAVAVRSKKETPIEDINKKFKINHPAYNGFTAGWKAIKQSLESLSRDEIKKFKLDKNYINMEVLYGHIPNAVPYSQTTNYVVFHDLTGNPENDWSQSYDGNEDVIMKQMAKKFGTIIVTTPNVTFTGDPDDVKREIEDVKSEWKFYGPISISENDIKKQLRKVVDEWTKYSEVKELIEFAKLEDMKDMTSLDGDALKDHQEKKYRIMKAATKKIGSAVLSNMVSKLSDTGQVVPGYPGIEGIVTKYGGDLVKITGNFLDYARPDTPSLDATKKLREVVQKEILGLTTTTLRNIKSLEQLYEYVTAKKKKSFGYSIDEGLPSEDKSKIKKAIETTKNEVREVVRIIQNKGRAHDLKNLLIQSFMLTNVEKQLERVNTYKDLLDLYGKELYGLE